LKEQTKTEIEVPKFVVRNPLFTARDTLLVIRNYLSEAINRHDPDYVFMPITNDLEPFWEMNIERGWFNSAFPPFTALFLALREFPLEFTQLVDGRMVNYDKDYGKILADFNRVYIRALTSKGGGWPKGTLSKDEFLRMCALFYIILMSSDRTQGVVFDSMGHLCNGWSGEPKLVNMSYKLAGYYSERLKACRFTAVDWQQFMFQSMSEHREDTVSWLFNLTRFDAVEGATSWDFSFKDYIQLLDMTRLLDPEYHQVTVVLQNTSELRYFMNGVYNKGLYFDDKSLGRKFSVVSNYKF